MQSMLRASLVLAVFCLPQFAQSTPDAAAGATLSQHERDYAMSQLQAGRKEFLDAVEGLTPEQWNFKAAPDRWSIAECAEHIAVSEDFIGGMIKDKLMKSPATPEKRGQSKVKDEDLTKAVTDRTQKFKAPEPIVPKKRWADPADAVAHFKESRDANIAYVEKTQDDVHDHFAPHPVAGPLDGYQWVLLMSAHTERHVAQIQEVKTDPKYPK
jgi:DinB superfamily